MIKNKKLFIFAVFIAIVATISGLIVFQTRQAFAAFTSYFKGIVLSPIVYCSSKTLLVKMRMGGSIKNYFIDANDAPDLLTQVQVNTTIEGYSVKNNYDITTYKYRCKTISFYNINIGGLVKKITVTPLPTAATPPPIAPVIPVPPQEGEPQTTTEEGFSTTGSVYPYDISGYPAPTPTPISTSYEYPSYFSLYPDSTLESPSPIELENILSQQEIPTKTVEFPFTATVNVRALRVRTEPNTSAPLGGSRYLYNNDKFITTSFAIGEKVEGENRWWISTKGNYVWVGGTKEKPY